MPVLLQINSCVNRGSTGKIVELIGQSAINNGWISHIAYGRNRNSSASKTKIIGDRTDIFFHGFESAVFDRHGLGSRNATRSLIKYISELNPDIIHLHNIHGYYINYPILFDYLGQANIPVVWTLHDCWAMTGHCSHFFSAGCYKWEKECHNCPKRKNYPASIILDRSNRNFHLKKQLFTSVRKMTIIPVSDWLGGVVQKSFLSKFPMQVISNGIDLKEFHPIESRTEIKARLNISKKFMLLGVATAWNKTKGWDDYCKLSHILPDEYFIVLVGLTRKQIHMLPPNIIGIKRTESKIELMKLYSAADIVLNLSYQESFGLTTIEGIACGTPGIVYNCTASPELLTPETGIIVNQGDYEQLISAIKRITSNGKEYYSANCRKRAEQFYDKESTWKKYQKVYEGLIN